MLHQGDVYDVMKILIVALIMMMMMVHPPTHPTTIVVSRKLKKIPMKTKKKWKLKIHQMVVTADHDHDDLHGCEEMITKMMMTMKKEKLRWIFMTF
jgi:hypothetical protein